MAGELNGTQAKVKEVYPKAIFIHCFAHVLNLVLSQSVSYIKECKYFFGIINSIAKFFAHSTKRVFALQEIIKLKIPNAAPTRWNYNSRTVNTIFQYREQLIEFFDQIVEHPENWDADTIAAGSGYLANLKDFKTYFFLSTFNLIFAETDVLYKILQKKCFEINYCINKIREAKSTLEEFRENFENVFSGAVDKVGPPRTNRICRTAEACKTLYRQIYFEIIDTILHQLSIRFEKLESLEFVELLNDKRYDNYKTMFPEQQLSQLKNQYGAVFDFTRIHNELTVVYKSSEFKNKPIFELFNYLKESDLAEALPEIFKLCKLIYTIPYTTASVERSFSCLKRVKTYARNTMGQERLSALALISIEKNELNNLKANNNFYEHVINRFCIKNRRIELLFK